jgi:DNA-binding NtrC family response regulator
VVARGQTIELTDLPTDLHSFSPSAGFVPRIDLSRPLPELIREVTAQLEKRYILKALKKTRGNVMRTAKICGLSRRSISAKLAEYDIDKSEFKESEG